jgi:hypothetical protein
MLASAAGFLGVDEMRCAAGRKVPEMKSKQQQ